MSKSELYRLAVQRGEPLPDDDRREELITEKVVRLTKEIEQLNAKVAMLNNKIVGLTKQRNAYKTADDARNKLIDWKVETGVKEKTKELNSLSSERDANAILTEEVEQLNTKVAMMLEAIEEIWIPRSY